MNSQDVLSKLQGNYDMDAGQIDGIINSATDSFDNNWRSKLSEQIGIDEAKKEQIDELTASTGLGLQMGKEAYNKIKARRAKLAKGRAEKLKKGEKDVKENETTDLDGKTPQSQTAPEDEKKDSADDPAEDPTVDDGTGSAVKSTKTLETVDEEPAEAVDEAPAMAEDAAVPEVSSSVPEVPTVSSVPTVSTEGVGSGEGIFGSGVDPTVSDLDEVPGGASSKAIDIFNPTAAVDEVEGATRGASLRFGVSGVRFNNGFNMTGANVEPRLKDFKEGQGIETSDVAPSRVPYPESWSNNSEISSDHFSGKSFRPAQKLSPVPEEPTASVKAPTVEEPAPAPAVEEPAPAPASAPETNAVLDTGEEGSNIVSDASQRVASSVNATVADGSEAVNGAINAGKTALKSGIEDVTASATEGLAGVIGEGGMTALGILGDVAPPVAVLAGTVLGIYDLFHHENAPHDPPKAPEISTALSRHGLVMPSSDGVIDSPASSSAF